MKEGARMKDATGIVGNIIAGYSGRVLIDPERNAMRYYGARSIKREEL
jgi:hypothetical protein